MNYKNCQDTLVLVPAFNEEKNILSILKDLQDYFTNILVIDDGSSDRTNFITKSNNIKCINHSINLGQGAALETGLKYFIENYKYKYVITFDGDGQHRSIDAYNMLQVAKKNNLKAVIGTRFLSKDSINQIPIIKRLTLYLAMKYEKLFYGIKLTDAHNGLRVLEKELVEKYILPIKSSGMNHGTEISSKISHSSLPFLEFPVKIIYKGKKSQNPLNAINILVNNIFYH